MPQNLKIADKRKISFHLPAGSGHGSLGVYNRTAHQNGRRNDGLPKVLSDVHEVTDTDVTSAGRRGSSEDVHEVTDTDVTSAGRRESTYSMRLTSRTSLYSRRASNVAAEDPDAIAAEYNLNGVAGFVWKRWAWYGPLVLACILTIFLAGPDNCQNFYMTPKEAPSHGALDSVEARHDEVAKHRDFLQLTFDYRDKSYGDLRDQYDAITPAVLNLDQTASDAATCSEFFLASLLPQLRSVNVTSPAAAQAALRRFRLEGFEQARRVLGPLLNEPVPVAAFVNTVATCTAENGPLVAWGCELMATTPRLGGGYVVGLDATTNLITQMMVMDSITQAAVTSNTFAESMVAAASLSIDDAGGRDAVIAADPMISDQNRQFVTDKFKAIMMSITDLNRYREVSDSSAAFNANDFRARSSKHSYSMLINVMEAVSTEWDAGLKDNGYAGMAVAHYANRRGRRMVVTDSSDDANSQGPRLKWHLGKHWVDSYVAWNLAFVTTALDPRVAPAGKLLIPSVLCSTGGSSSGLAHDDFYTARAYSLWLQLMQSGNNPNYTSTGAVNPAWAIGFGRSNLQNLQIPAPKKDKIDEMVNSFAPEMSLWAWVDPGSWRFVSAVAMFGSVLVLGWGSELLSAAVLFAPPPEPTAFDAATHARETDARANNRIKNGWWRLAQLAFPLFLTIAVFSRSVFGLPFLCVGLWKFGFPETVTALVAGHLADAGGEPVSHLAALGSFMSGLGTVFHHTATAWYVCKVVAGISSPSADPTGNLAVALPLVLQHWIVQFKYINFYVYVGLLLVTEIWWEFEVVVHMPKFRFWHEQRCLWGMLVSHWLYWLGAIATFASATNRMADNDGDGDGGGAEIDAHNERRGTMGFMGDVMASRQASKRSKKPATHRAVTV